ncbi:MAG: hypothetical protein QM490_00575 [Candidatus Gracilibacteria bacterium]
MELQIKTHLGNELTDSKNVVERLVGENLNKKLDQYLNKFDKENAEGIIETSVEKNKKGLFNGKVQANLDGKSYRFEREDYKNLDDLINHLFDHFKQALSDEK